MPQCVVYGGKEIEDGHLQADEKQEGDGIADQKTEKGLLELAGSDKIADCGKAGDYSDEDRQYEGQPYGPVRKKQ